MKPIILFILTPITNLIKYFILKYIDLENLVEVEKTITKGFDMTWVNLDNIVKIQNKHGLSYVLKEVKLNFFNEQEQPIGKLHYNTPILVPKKSTERIIMASKMSNITAIFNAARLLLVDELEMRAKGYSLIKILWFDLKIPMDDMLKVEKGKLQYGTDEEVAKRKERAQIRRAKRKERREEWLEKQKNRREAIKAERRKKKEDRIANRKIREQSKNNPPNPTKKPKDQDDPSAFNESSEDLT